MRRSRFQITVIVYVTIISLVTLPAMAQQNAREVFERARMLDESNQNLSEAIKLYGEVVNHASGERVLAGRAQFRIGILYERLGRKAEALRAFQVVANQYSDQSDLAQRARAKLPASTAKTNLNAKKKLATSEGTALTVRQVWAGPSVDFLGAPSADGHYLPVTDWETGDLGIRDLVTGQTRRLTNKGSWMQSTAFAIFPVLSPDGKQVAYSWFNKEYGWELRVIGTDGSAPRVLYKGTATNSDWVFAAGWTPDGKYIAALIAESRAKAEVDLVSATDGSRRVLKPLSESASRAMGLLRFSPDGRYIAYETRQKPDSKENDILLFNVETKEEIPLVQHPANDFSPIWTLDGKNILFASDRTGTLGFWLQPVADGKPKGPPQLIKSDLGSVWPMGFTRNGSFYYGLDSGMNDVYVASIDFNSGKVLEAPAPLSQRYVGSNSAPAWSPDGKYLAYVSQRGPGTTSLTSRDKVLVIRSLDTGQEREVPVSLSLINRPQWWPDGQSILVAGNDKRSRVGIYRVDAQTGEVKVLVQEEGNNYRFPMLSPDGKTLSYLRINFPKGTWSIRARDLQSNGENEIFSVSPPNGIANMGLSPDGQQLAFVVGDRTKPQVAPLRVMPISGGETRDVCQIIGDLGALSRLIWTPDGQKILFTVRRQDPAKPVNSDQTFELWQVSAAGGQPQKVGLAMERLRALSLHPDGKRLAFAAGQSKPEVWVMENFLPANKLRATSVSRR